MHGQTLVAGVFLLAVATHNAVAMICPAGRYSDQGTCLDCSPGEYCPDGSTYPHPCPPGSYCQFANVSVPCRRGSYCPTASQYEQPCPAGSYCPTSATITRCGAGEYCEGGSAAPRPCMRGYYCPNATIAIACPAGAACPDGSASPQLPIAQLTVDVKKSAVLILEGEIDAPTLQRTIATMHRVPVSSVRIDRIAPVNSASRRRLLAVAYDLVYTIMGVPVSAYCANSSARCGSDCGVADCIDEIQAATDVDFDTIAAEYAAASAAAAAVSAAVATAAPVQPTSTPSDARGSPDSGIAYTSTVAAAAAVSAAVGPTVSTQSTSTPSDARGKPGSDIVVAVAIAVPVVVCIALFAAVYWRYGPKNGRRRAASSPAQTLAAAAATRPSQSTPK